MKYLLACFITLACVGICEADQKLVRPTIGIADEGAFVGRVSTINCVGAGVTCTQSGSVGTLSVTATGGGGVSQSSVGVYNGTTFVGSATSVTFTGSGLGGITFQNSMATVTISGGGGAADNLGTHIATQVLSMNGFGIQGSSGVNIGTITPNSVALLFIASGTGYTGQFIKVSSSNLDSPDYFGITTTSMAVKVATGILNFTNSVFGSTQPIPAVTMAIGNGSDNPGIWNNGAGFAPLLYLKKANHAVFDLRDTNGPSLVEMIMHADSGQAIFGTFSNHALQFHTNNTLRGSIGASGGLTMKTTDFVLKADGSGVGIGTTTPKADLHLALPNGATLQSFVIMSTGASRAYEFTSTSFTCNTTFFIGANTVFNTTATSVNLSGYTIMTGTGNVAGNSTLTITPLFPSGLSPTIVAMPMISEYNNTGLTSDALEVGTWNPGSATFTVKNQDVTNARNFIWWCFGQ